MKETLKYIGNQILEAVKESGQTKTKICKECHIERTQLNHIINGTSNYTVEVLTRVVLYLEIEEINLKHDKSHIPI